MRPTLSALFLAAALASLLAPPDVDGQTVPVRRLVVEPSVTGLARPTAFVFLDADTLLVMEKATGRVRLVRRSRVADTVLDLDVNAVSERGGLGLELDPAFADNGFVYVYYSAASAGDGSAWTANVVARYRWNGTRLVAPTTLLRFPRTSLGPNGPNHDGGTLRFGPDGYLYGVVGDLNRGTLNQPRIEQNTGDEFSSGGGGIFRIDRDGGIPEDNPFADHPVEEVRKWFVYGVRNGFGLDFDPRTGRLWFTENGPNVYDELNVAVPGMNSGWRLIMGPDDRDAFFAENGRRTWDADDLVQLPGSVYRDPAFSWLRPVGVTALAFVDSRELIPRLRNRILVGDANTGDLYLFHPRGTRREALRLPPPLRDTVADDGERRRVVWGRGFGVVTDIRVGPDGAVYVSDLATGTIWRIRRR